MSTERDTLHFASLLEEFKWRGFFEQCTDEEGLTELLSGEPVCSVTGIDPSPSSVGRPPWWATPAGRPSCGG